MSRKSHLVLKVLLSGLLGSNFLVACNGNNNSSTISSEQKNAKSLKIGSLLPSTGDLSSIGQNLPTAVKLAVDTVNACGGVNGEPVTFISEDDGTDPSVGAAAMTKLTEVNKVNGVVGSFASSVSSAALDIAIRNKVMLISPGSTSPVFTERAKKGELKGYWARTAPPDTYQAEALALLAYKKGFKRVATVVINNDYGVGFEQAFDKAFQKLGGTVININKPVRYDPKAATLDSEAAQALTGKPDAVLAVLYEDTGSLLLQSAYKQGLTKGVTFLLTDGVYSEEFTKKLGTGTDGKSIIANSLGTVPGAHGKSLASFSKLWQDKTNKTITAYVPQTWDAAVLLMLAAQDAKSNSGEAIKSKLRDVSGSSKGTPVSDPCLALRLLRSGKKVKYQGASGDLIIDANGDVVGSYDVWTVQDDGKLKIIDEVTPKP
jgi:neutral amino acid transport system substrate-binding protein